jgi:hypothetical protein
MIGMNCRAAMDKVYESLGDGPLPFLDRLELALHLLFCPRCAGEYRKLEAAWDAMRTGFFPPSPDFEEPVMFRILDEEPEPEIFDAPAGFSFRGWVITGVIVLFSLVTACFGMDFMRVARDQGSSFLLPLGLTIALVLTGYGALFIGSHLKELSARFGLH